MPHLSIVFAMLTCGTMLSVATGQSPPDPAPGLLQPVSVERGPGTHRRAEVVRHREVTIDFQRLASIDPLRRERVIFDLFDDVTFTGVIRRRTWPGRAAGFPDSYALSGSIDGADHGTFNLVVHQDVVAALITLPGRTTYQIHARGDGGHEVCQLDFSTHVGCVGEPAHGPPGVSDPVGTARVAPDASADALVAGATTIIDVMIVYTPAARAVWGGTAATEAEALLAIDLSNTAFIDSQIEVEFNLVHVAEFAYTETGSSNLDLNNVTFDTALNTLRDQVEADNVSLFISGSIGCGSGWTLSPTLQNPVARSYNICVIGCAAQNRTYLHEVGHNLGCAHEPSAGGTGMFVDSRGHVDPGVVFRTILAIDEATPRVGRFSNPLVDLGGVTTGVFDVSDNARTIAITRTLMATFRGTSDCAELPIDCNGNCLNDAAETVTGLSPDCNLNGIPDECEPDCNGNDRPDDCDLQAGFSDCNGNGVLDSCDTASGNAADCNMNRKPDECEPDCNGNGLPDECDIADGAADDCNLNGVPDECEDCDGNGIADECEIASGEESDCNLNNVPDGCEDCDGDGVADECDFPLPALFVSPQISPYSTHYTFAELPAAFGDVEFAFAAHADVEGYGRWLIVFLNETLIGELFTGPNTENCVRNVQREQLTLADSVFNTLVTDGVAEILITAGGGEPRPCLPEAWITISLSMSHLVPGTMPDVNANGMYDGCERAKGDVTLDGVIGIDDFLAVLAAWGPCPASCPADTDADGQVGIEDFLIVLTNWN